MRRQLVTFATLAAVALLAAGCPGNGPEPEPEPDPKPEPDPETIAPDFTSADMFYDPWEYETARGQFEIYLYDRGDTCELYIESFADPYENYLDAALSEGTYVFATSRARHTFNDQSHLTVWDEEGEDTRIAVTGGEFTLTENGDGYSLSGSFDLADGRVLVCDYRGAIFDEFEPNVTADVEVDFSLPAETDVEAYPRGDGGWAISLWIETPAVQEMIALGINAEPGGETLPTGSFPMAEAIGSGVAGTAEPLDVYPDDIFGCGWSRATVLGGWLFNYAVPGEGAVEISRDGDIYTIDFSFTGPDGHTVSGSYTGRVDHYEY